MSANGSAILNDHNHEEHMVFTNWVQDIPFLLHMRLCLAKLDLDYEYRKHLLVRAQLRSDCMLAVPELSTSVQNIKPF